MSDECPRCGKSYVECAGQSDCCVYCHENRADAALDACSRCVRLAEEHGIEIDYVPGILEEQEDDGE